MGTIHASGSASRKESGCQMTDAQRSLEYLQWLKVNCDGKCDAGEDCEGFAFKYPSLQWFTINDVNLNDLLRDAAKWGWSPYVCTLTLSRAWIVGFINRDEETSMAMTMTAATPIEAALVALAKAENQPDREES